MTDLEKFYDHNGQVMAVLVKKDYSSDGINFITDEKALFQVAYMKHSAEHIIIPHFHNRIPRIIEFTSEVLIIRRGVLEVVLYEEKVERFRFNIEKGDILVLYSGGHGFRTIKDVEMVEIKQGPFLGEKDKTRF